MQELPFLRSARRLMLIDICMKFREDSFRGFQVIERTRFVTDRQTDRRTSGRPGKNNMSPNPSGGDIILTWRFYHRVISQKDGDKIINGENPKVRSVCNCLPRPICPKFKKITVFISIKLLFTTFYHTSNWGHLTPPIEIWAASIENLLFAYAKTKAQITAQLISVFVYTTQIVQSLYFLNSK